MTRSELLRFMRNYPLAVEASVSSQGPPQAAVVGVAIGDAFELVFDTLQSTRKAVNLSKNPRIAFVFGGWGAGEEQTVQYEGVADRPSGAELERVRELYFSVYPDGRGSTLLGRAHPHQGAPDVAALQRLHALSRNHPRILGGWSGRPSIECEALSN